MKDLSYLQAFSPKILREARRVIGKGFTAEDIDKFLEVNKLPVNKKIRHLRYLPQGIRQQIIAKTHFGKKKP